MLLKCPSLTAETRAALRRRVGKPAPKEVVESYTTAQFAAIRRAALRCVHAAETRILGNMAVLRRFWAGEDLDTATLAKARALELVLDGGELTSADYKAIDAWKPGRPLVTLARYSLFLRWDEAWACAVLLVCENGWNSTVITRATVPSTAASAGEEVTIYTQDLFKPRRGRERHMTNNLVDDGQDGPGRTMTRIINATEPARLRLARHGEPTNRLLIWLNRRYATVRGRAAFRVGPPTEKRSRRVSPWVTEDLPNITLIGLRQVHQSRIKRSSGQNSRHVHEDVYLLRDAVVRQESEGLIAQGQQNALDAALGRFRMRLLDEAEVDQRIRSGAADTPVGACEDIHHHPVTGEVCRENFLACLGCENAVATPRHLPRLVFLAECLDELASALHPDDWRDRWSEPYIQLTALLDTHTTLAERGQARAHVTPLEKSLIDRLLRGEFAP
ncbi:hypothetical protein M8C13_05160 [Crossiella sp. SN42]|uniref:hypothetical protein n=1 Tax=Crossiella sp. SN42 TaxID=2944808 RepID=UPI00207D255C|nr:hypothetical protein [Crossiella sp. SN42]MCO1575147.1 hypothetical protein [Crossiella sp. SN42]